MKVVFRVDASLTIGHGHVMRCLTLADMLRDHDAVILFVCREFEGHLCDLLEERGFAVRRLPAPKVETQTVGTPTHEVWLGASWEEDAEQTCAAIDALGGPPDWLVVDHYAIDHRWETALRTAAGHITVIDDLADRAHDCDLLLDQNYFPNASERYVGLLPPYCNRFLGPEYVLLRQEFRTAKLASRTVRQSRLLLFFGGGDVTRQTETALKAVLSFDSSLAMDVVVGSSNPRASAIQMLCQDLPQVRFFRQTENMAALMATASLCLGAGGISTFERLYMDLPSIVVATAPNQIEPLQSLAELGCIDYLGEATDIGKAEWIAALQRWKTQGLKQAVLAVGARTDRVLAAMLVKLVPFGECHVERTFHFLQDEDLRASFAMAEPPNWPTHVRYWQDKLSRKSESVFAIEWDGEHIGNCGIKPVPGADSNEGWIYLSRAAQVRAGLGEAAFCRLLGVAFKKLRLPCLYLHVRHDNKVALGLYRKVGLRLATEPVDPAIWGEHTADMCKLVIAR